MVAQRLDEGLECLSLGSRLDVHAVACVEHPARDVVGNRLAIDERPETHALNDARDMDVLMFDDARCHAGSSEVEARVRGRAG